MSIFDLTPPGAYMNAIKAANAKDRQNVRRTGEQPAGGQRNKRHADATLATRILNRAHKMIKGLRLSTGLRSKTP